MSENRPVKVLAYLGPSTVGEETGECQYCHTSIHTVLFEGMDPIWFHVGTCFRKCPSGLTEAAPMDFPNI